MGTVENDPVKIEMTCHATTCRGEDLELAGSLQEAGAAPDPALGSWPASEVPCGQGKWLDRLEA